MACYHGYSSLHLQALKLFTVLTKLINFKLPRPLLMCLKCMLYYCNMVRLRPVYMTSHRAILQCFDTVGWVIHPPKPCSINQSYTPPTRNDIVSDLYCNVLIGTLILTRPSFLAGCYVEIQVVFRGFFWVFSCRFPAILYIRTFTGVIYCALRL